jgi:aspartate oxidase
VRDHREVTMLMRAEINALTALLLKKGVCTQEELQQQMILEFEHLDAAFEQRFPGIRTTIEGLDIDPKVAPITMAGWKP